MKTAMLLLICLCLIIPSLTYSAGSDPSQAAVEKFIEEHVKGETPLPEALTEEVRMIENANPIQSRLKQEPNLGQNVCAGNIVMDIYPDIFGGLLEILLGGASTGSVTDSTYIHTWLIPTSGERIAESMTVGQALGADTEDRYDGVIITGISLAQDNAGNLEATLRCVPQDQSTNGGSRATASGYSTKIPLNFSFASTITLTPAGDSAVSVDVDNLTIDIDLGYDPERFKLGSANIKQPVFNTIPTMSIGMTVDAQRTFVDYAKQHKEFDIDLSWVSTENAAGTTKFQFDIEVSDAKLATDTNIPYENDAATMELNFDCGYGGTTTGSGSTEVIAEIRLKDANSSWT